jgi:hypothetical protein
MIEHLEKREYENDVIFAYMQYNSIGNWYGLIEDAIIQDGVESPTFITILSNTSFETINKLSGNFNLSKKTPEIDKFYEFVSMCKGLIPYLPKEFPAIDKNSYKKSLLVETRELEHNEFVIKNTIQKLGDGWGHIIYCHNNNYVQIKSICDGISPDIEIRLLDFDLTRNTYNNLCLDINFWNEIDCEKVLIYQTDTFIFRDFRDEFMQYDYVGAPISDNGNHVVGNGGLSLRTVKLIKNILNNFNISINTTEYKSDNIPEDRYYSHYMQSVGGNVPSITDALEFSFECKIVDNMSNNSFASHRPWFTMDFNEFFNRICLSLQIPLLHIYVITWNNSEKLEYFINYYRSRFNNCKITVYDNMSSDDTKNIIYKYNCIYKSFDTLNKLCDTTHQNIKNTCWKEQDEIWAFCLDDDELLDIHAYDLFTETSDVIEFIGIERFNREKHMINNLYNKSVSIRVKNVPNLRFKVGSHSIENMNQYKKSNNRYFLIHDKFSNEEFILRNYHLSERSNLQYLENNFSWHYKIDTLKYYLYGIRNGVDYKDINRAPKIRFQDFMTNDFINNLNDVDVEFYTNSKIKRYDIINFLIDRYNLKEYLEIGVFKGENIRMINVVNKNGVDPGAENQIAPEVTHVMTSDVFFNQIDFNKKYDIVFIDGLHEYSQVKKDIQNSFKHLSKDGFIVLHDCNPVSYESQYPIRKTMAWNGDVWKAFVEFKNNNPHHYSCVIDTDFGVGVIKNNHNIEPIFDNTINIDYFKFISDKNKYLNLINWETFKIVVDKDFNHKKYNKIFQIGFNKCGTTSLHKMFIDSGLKSVHWDGGNIAKKIDSNIKQNKPPLDGVDNYDCYTDIENVETNTFPLINYYELLDKAYPNSLFILNTRPLDNWIQSRLNHQGGEYANTFKKVLGVDTNEELVKIWTEQWDGHHNKAIDYFKNCDNFIIFDIETEGDKLTDFLRTWSIPVTKFPHLHKSF